MKSKNRLFLPAQEIPLIADVDIAVIGGSFAGIAAALEYAKQGKKVMVVESRTYLGAELTAVNKPWIDMNERDMDTLPDLVRTVIEKCGRCFSDEEKSYVVFQVDYLKRYLEDKLNDSNIKLLYASLPISISMEQHGELQLVIANKSGRQLIRCKQIIDTTNTAISAFISDHPVDIKADKAYYRCVIELDKVQWEDRLSKLTVPSEFGIKDNQLSIYEGYHGEGHQYLSFKIKLPAKNTLEMNQLRVTRAKEIAMEIMRYLVQNHVAFQKAILCSISDELEGPFLLDDEVKNTNQAVRSMEHLSFQSAAVLSFYYDFYKNNHTEWLDMIKAVEMAVSIANHKWKEKQGLEIENVKEVKDGSESHHIRIPNDLLNQISDFAKVDEVPVHHQHTTEVLVAGGGSSGGLAAITAANEGMDTTLIDLNPGLGGTGTFGGVDGYWFGRIRGYSEKLQNKVKALEKEINYRGGKWNIEAKKHTLLTMANEANTNLLFNSIIFGAMMDKNRVTGVVAATKWGVYSIAADCVIDATGDGDVAAFAGASYIYGSARDHVVMWYSLAQYKRPGRLQNNFTSMVNIEDIEDYTRAIMVGRRRNSGHDCHDHGTYIATRESRHVTGDVTMTITDQLLHRAWKDVINIHFSNHDMKGVNHADWLNFGLIPPNLEIEISYRMLLPKGLEGILVAGKAISATHDAFPAIRMQADLENLGAICGIAAAESVKRDLVPRELNIMELQKRLVKEKLLPASVLEREISSFIYSKEDMETLIDQIEVKEPLYEYSRMKMNEIYEDIIPFVEICMIGPKIVPLLKEAHQKAEGVRKIRLAQALAFYEDKAAIPTLMQEINNLLRDGTLPKRTADILYVTTPPDHGAMPDVCYLLYSLAMTNSKESLPIWQKVVDGISDRPIDYRDKLWGMFYYVHAVAHAAERLAIPEFIPILKQLHQKKPINNQHCTHGLQPDYYLERRAMLELSVARALARCGSVEGYKILTNYLNDVRSLLRKQAHKELCELTEEDFGVDKDVWMDWVNQYKKVLPQKASRFRSDLTYTSEEIARNLPFYLKEENQR